MTEEIAGLNAKVTYPLSSIFSTFAPNVIPAVPCVALHDVTPSSVVTSKDVVTVSPTLTKPSLANGLPIAAESNPPSADATPETMASEFSPNISVGEAIILAFSFFIFISIQLAKLLFRYENPPGKKYISGSQDAIGLTHPGINKLDFDCGFWPNKIETCLDEDICRWLEKHLLLVPIGERPNRYDPLMEQNINRQSVQKLSMAGMNCYNSILRKDLNGLGKSLTDTHDAWREILPLTTNKEIDNILNSYDNCCAGRTTSGCGGGYVILATNHEIENSIKIKIIR